MATIIGSVFAAWITSASTTSKEIGNVRFDLAQKDSSISERVARLETTIPAMSQNIQDIKNSVDALSRAFNVKVISK